MNVYDGSFSVSGNGMFFVKAVLSALILSVLGGFNFVSFFLLTLHGDERMIIEQTFGTNVYYEILIRR